MDSDSDKKRRLENDVIDDALQLLRDYANGPYKIIENDFYNNIRVVVRQVI